MAKLKMTTKNEEKINKVGRDYGMRINTDRSKVMRV